MMVWLQVWWILFHGLFSQAVYPFPGPANPVPSLPTSGLLLWWDTYFGSNCSGACSDGGSQVTFADQSGNGNNATLTPVITATCVASVYHTNQLNGQPATTFNGNNTSGSETCFTVGNSGTGLDNKSTTTLIAVVKFASGPGVELTIAGGSTNVIRWEGNGIGGGSSLQGAFQGASSSIGFGTAGSDTSNFHLLIFTYDSGSGAYAFRKDCAADGSGTNAKTINSNWLMLGADNSGGAHNTLNGQIARFALYNRVLSAGEITTVETNTKFYYGTFGGGC